ncbi:MAG: HNH endonuclease [Candidatus Saccharimonas sp.]|nr:HNH endonuclease [Planctomycetaceae bacterium]
MSDKVSAALRELARSRSEFRCEYCLIGEEEVFLPHEPDHIIAVKHGGLTVSENLAWACFLCNRFKGSDLASVDPVSDEIVRLFDPRSQRWSNHFQIDQGRIEGRTPEGRATARMLRFNLPDAVNTRRRLIASGRFAVAR